MLLIFVIFFCMAGIYLGFCVEANNYTFTGKYKQIIISVFLKIESSKLEF